MLFERHTTGDIVFGGICSFVAALVFISLGDRQFY